MSRLIEENIGKLVWYAECMDRSLKQIREFKMGVNYDEFRFSHAMFIVNFMSMLDFANEIFDRKVLIEWENNLDGIGGKSGKNNSGYIRELRNSVIHRGFDLTANGTVIDGRAMAIAPIKIGDRHSRRPPFYGFTYTLHEKFEICRLISSITILKFAEPSLKILESKSQNDKKHELIYSVENSEHIPDWIKISTKNNANEITRDFPLSINARKLRSLLSQE
ncbi:MAG: hypothetical protein H2042_07415 [Rhizobiales bacterium]|nr:hypothetical protein [Hyphomicrobiales bacterium]